MKFLSAAKQWARSIKRDVVTIYFAARDPATPWQVRLLALAVAAGWTAGGFYGDRSSS